MTTDAGTEPVLWLFAECLLAKSGFNDGDAPDGFLDWCDERGIDYNMADWHPVLRRLVREHLVPALDQRVEVVDIETCHNPIRASKVDGVDVEECWYGRQDEPTLTPDGVSVPYTTVARVMAEVGKEEAA